MRGRRQDARGWGGSGKGRFVQSVLVSVCVSRRSGLAKSKSG